MPITYATTVNVPTGLFDRTGTNDVTIALSNWLNDTNNVPHGPSATVHTRVLFPKFQADGTTRALYRIEGGLTGAGLFLGANLVNVTLDGGGTPGNRGVDGAQFIQKLQFPYTVAADPTANPRGLYRSDGTTSSANNVLNCPSSPLSSLHVGDVIEFRHRIDSGWLATTTYAADTRVSVNFGGRRPQLFQSLVSNNKGHDPMADTAGGTAAVGTWWRNIGLTPHTSNVTGINVGGDSHKISYDGFNQGNYLGGNVPNGPNWYLAFAAQPTLQWNVLYAPTGQINVSYAGGASNAALGTAYTMADRKRDDLNGSATFWLASKCSHLRFAHMQMTGSNMQSANNGPLEARDGIKFRGVDDCMVDDCTIEHCWGNGFQVLPFAGTDPASIGVWVYQSHIAHFGRQCASFQYGGQIIVEECFMHSTARSMMDIEPTSSPSQKDPRLGALVDGVFLYNNTIGHHGIGGLIGLHRDIINMHVKGNSGETIDLSSLSVVDNLIFELNTNTSGATGNFRFVMGVGDPLGGHNIIIRNNSGYDTGDLAGVVFRPGNQANVTAASNGVHTNTLTGTQSIAVDDSSDYDPPGPAIVGTAGTTTITWTSRDATHLKNVTGHGPDKVLLTGMVLPTANGAKNYSVTGNDFGGKPQFLDQSTMKWAGTFVPFPPPTPRHAMRDAIANDSVIIQGVQAVESDQALAGTVTVDDVSQTGKYYVIK